MHRNDQFSADVIKIFHNAKGSLKTKILEWTDTENEKYKNKTEHRNAEWKAHHDSPHNYAAGEYEPLLHDQITLIYDTDSNESSTNRHSRSEFRNKEKNNVETSFTNTEPTPANDKNHIADRKLMYQSQDELDVDDL